MPDRSSLILDALSFFHGWLCGEGLTSPGVLLDEEALKSELKKLDVVVRKLQRSDLFPVNLAPLVATAAAGGPKQELEDGLVWKLRRLDQEDRRLLRLSIELYLEEVDSLAMFFKPSVTSDDLRALDQVWNELGRPQNSVPKRSGAKLAPCRITSPPGLPLVGDLFRSKL